MKLTTEMLEPYTHGGQLEIWNPNERYLDQGEIATAIVEDNILKVTFVWLGEFDQGQWWRNTKDLVVELNLRNYDITVVNKRILLHYHAIGEVLAFLLPGDKTITWRHLKFRE